MVRAKMRLHAVETVDFGGPAKQTKLKFLCQYDQRLAEDVSFCKATPSGSAEFVVDNPAALEQFKVGECYYVDFTQVPKQ